MMPASGAGGRRFESDQPHTKLVSLFSPISIDIVKLQAIMEEENKLVLSNPYHMFKFSIRTELTRKYYERRIRKFFDYIEFYSDKCMEERCKKN